MSFLSDYRTWAVLLSACLLAAGAVCACRAIDAAFDVDSFRATQARWEAAERDRGRPAELPEPRPAPVPERPPFGVGTLNRSVPITFTPSPCD
jgi:hypothetical protein